VVAWCLPPVLAFAALGISLLFPGVEYSPQMAGFFDQLSVFVPPQQLEEMKSRPQRFGYQTFGVCALNRRDTAYRPESRITTGR